jgi:small GTP-binding protein
LAQLTKKICLLGDYSVGKTSLVRRFIESRFDENYLSTLGVSVSRKVIQIEQPSAITLTMLLWDTNGGGPFNTIVRTYYQGSSGALLVGDLTRASTVAALHNYAAEFRNINPGVPLVLIGNKVDLVNTRMVSDETLAEVAEAHKAQWLLGSAKTGQGVDQAFQLLATAITQRRSNQ